MNPYKSSQRVSHLRRCFYAVRFSTDVLDYLDGLMLDLRSHGANVRWTPRRNVHLTLRFLGDLDERQVRRAGEISRAIPEGPIHVRGDGLGAFPSLRAPRILWAGVSTDTDDERARLMRLQETTERHAQSLGLPREQRPWRPHVTLARVPFPSPGLRPLIDDITTRECRSPLSAVTDLFLMESLMSQGGVEYRVLNS